MLKIKGKVVKGLGEGSFYVEKYNPLFKEYLGFECFPGTINLELVEGNIDGLKRPITIQPRGYVAVKCYKITINESVEGAIVVPEVTKHARNIIEVIAPVKMDVKEGDLVTCQKLE